MVKVDTGILSVLTRGNKEYVVRLTLVDFVSGYVKCACECEESGAYSDCSRPEERDGHEHEQVRLQIHFLHGRFLVQRHSIQRYSTPASTSLLVRKRGIVRFQVYSTQSRLHRLYEEGYREIFESTARRRPLHRWYRRKTRGVETSALQNLTLRAKRPSSPHFHNPRELQDPNSSPSLYSGFCTE